MRKFFLIGIIATILIAVPLTVYILTTQKTQTQSGAAPSTILAFDIPTDPAQVGIPIAIPVTVDPTGGGSTGNQVSFVKLVITYDGSKLQTANNYFVPDTKLSTLEGPSNSCDGTKCTITVTLTTGADPASALSSEAPLGTLNFNPLAATDANSPTQLGFGAGNQVLSIASTDKPAENVLNRAQPGSLTIISNTTTPSPTSGDNGGGGNNGGGGGDNGGGTGGGTGGGGGDNGGGGTASGLSCDSLTADNTTADTTPFTALFTVTGSSTDGNISKVSFNFGDGTVQDITSGSGVGTSSISAQQSHVYKTSGVFTATAVLTDDTGNTTNPSDCSQTITIGGTSTDTPTSADNTQPSTAPTIPPTGPGSVLVGVGIAGIAIMVVGIAVITLL